MAKFKKSSKSCALRAETRSKNAQVVEGGLRALRACAKDRHFFKKEGAFKKSIRLFAQSAQTRSARRRAARSEITQNSIKRKAANGG